jgi:hypothetical protein
MSGWRQEQYLDQAYHAMALQPVHAKLPVRPVAHWLLTFALLYSGVSFAQGTWGSTRHS